MIGGNGVENEVETPRVLFHLVGIAGDNDFVGAESKRVLLLVRRMGENSNVSSERASELYSHVTQSAETDYANSLALTDTPVAHWRKCCDARAEQRSGSGKLKV